MNLCLASRQLLNQIRACLLSHGQRLHALESLYKEIVLFSWDFHRRDACRIGQALFLWRESKKELMIIAEMRIPHLIAANDTIIIVFYLIR